MLAICYFSNGVGLEPAFIDTPKSLACTSTQLHEDIERCLLCTDMYHDVRICIRVAILHNCSRNLTNLKLKCISTPTINKPIARSRKVERIVRSFPHVGSPPYGTRPKPMRIVCVHVCCSAFNLHFLPLSKSCCRKAMDHQQSI